MNKKDLQEDKKAVAISYNQKKDVAPKIVAKGKGYVADNILSVAKSNSVPIYTDKTMVNMLMAIEIDKEIPPALYTAMAEILVYVYNVDKKAGKPKDISWK